MTSGLDATSTSASASPTAPLNHPSATRLRHRSTRRRPRAAGGCLSRPVIAGRHPDAADPSPAWSAPQQCDAASAGPTATPTTPTPGSPDAKPPRAASYSPPPDAPARVKYCAPSPGLSSPVPTEARTSRCPPRQDRVHLGGHRSEAIEQAVLCGQHGYLVPGILHAQLGQCVVRLAVVAGPTCCYQVPRVRAATAAVRIHMLDGRAERQADPMSLPLPACTRRAPAPSRPLPCALTAMCQKFIVRRESRRAPRVHY